MAKLRSHACLFCVKNLSRCCGKCFGATYTLYMYVTGRRWRTIAIRYIYR